MKISNKVINRIIKESVDKVLAEKYAVNEWGDILSPDALDDKAYMDDYWAEREKRMTDDWEYKNREIRKKYPGKSEEWYEAMIDTM